MGMSKRMIEHGRLMQFRRLTRRGPLARLSQHMPRALCVGLLVVAALTLSVVSLALASSAFSDVPAGHPYHDAIAELGGKGVISGYPDGRFGPENPVTRQQFAKMIVLAMDYGYDQLNHLHHGALRLRS